MTRGLKGSIKREIGAREIGKGTSFIRAAKDSLLMRLPAAGVGFWARSLRG
jgi:hypothetical protein